MAPSTSQICFSCAYHAYMSRLHAFWKTLRQLRFLGHRESTHGSIKLLCLFFFSLSLSLSLLAWKTITMSGVSLNLPQKKSALAKKLDCGMAVDSRVIFMHCQRLSRASDRKGVARSHRCCCPSGVSETVLLPIQFPRSS